MLVVRIPCTQAIATTRSRLVSLCFDTRQFADQDFGRYDQRNGWLLWLCQIM
jgi:hypothetical protein